ncbi:MAG: glycoside hydrolase family 15 protein [Pirellulales bacterium]
MALRIEDYALIGDCQTAALVGLDGSIDWLCLPRFDSGACFAALLGKPEHGRWLICPQGNVRRTSRRYRGDTLILETSFETDEGEVTLIDSMPPRSREPDLVRVVSGRRAKVPMRMQFILRPDYGSIVPWVRRTDRGITAVAGPDCFLLDSDVPLYGKELTTVAEFDIAAGEQRSFVLSWHPSHEEGVPKIDTLATLDATEKWWRKWSSQCTYEGAWHSQVMRSLITLKALTYAPTGGIVAAATTSLPEQLGGVRNWDYRYCWVRDATFTLYSLITNGYTDEALAWREWLLRAVAGNASQLNIMYGIAGERRLTEVELDWLPGYENARPVRIGNAAYKQFQLDVFGELMDAIHVARRAGLTPDENAWRVERELMDFLETGWREPDEGIWEVRGPRRHFTHSKVMAWVAVDRMVKAVERFGHEGPVYRWRALREEIHAEVCQRGYDPKRNTFVQFYGGAPLDASLLMIPLVGFLPGTDPRVSGTVAAIQRELMRDGFVDRYPTQPEVDGLPSGEGAFLACTFWLADNLLLLNRRDEAEQLFERLLSLCNDVGLLSEEYDPHSKRLVGNFPQAFSHIGLVNTACNLSRGLHPAEDRPGE